MWGLDICLTTGVGEENERRANGIIEKLRKRDREVGRNRLGEHEKLMCANDHEWAFDPAGVQTDCVLAFRRLSGLESSSGIEKAPLRRGFSCPNRPENAATARCINGWINAARLAKRL